MDGVSQQQPKVPVLGAFPEYHLWVNYIKNFIKVTIQVLNPI